MLKLLSVLYWTSSQHLFVHCTKFVFVPTGYAGSDDGEDERTGIAEGGWREEKAESKTQLNRDMEKENGERK